jgi:hypothetical protein
LGPASASYIFKFFKSAPETITPIKPKTQPTAPNKTHTMHDSKSELVNIEQSLA